MKYLEGNFEIFFYLSALITESTSPSNDFKSSR